MLMVKESRVFTRKPMPMLKWVWLSGFVLVVDQITKWFANTSIALYETIEVIPFFNFTLAYNYGAAFSFLADAGGWQRWFFTVIAAVFSIVIIVWLAKLKSSAKLEAISLSLILGGAIGNLIDRVIYGYVIDFLDVYYQDYHWPAFNIADSAICVGAVLLILDSFRSTPEEEK
jgi:signal peptidase II